VVVKSKGPLAIAALRSVLSVCYARPSMNASYREVAVDAATRAGALLRAHLGGTREVSYKGSPINLVTEMDRRSEALIDELPSAYKDIDQVMADQKDLVDVVATLKQVVSIKGD